MQILSARWCARLCPPGNAVLPGAAVTSLDFVITNELSVRREIPVILAISCGGRPMEVEISGASGNERFSIGGREILFDWIRLADGHYSIIVDGRVFDLAVEAEGESFRVEGRQGKCKLQVRDPRCLITNRAVREVSPGLQRLHAEMPGKVIRVLVRIGDAVSFDQALLVIEAMKMQNEIRAPKAGRIKELAIAEGRAVNSGEFLLSVE